MSGLGVYEAEDILKAMRDDLMVYTMMMNPGYVPARHHIKLSNFLMDIFWGRVDRGMVFMPPRHGKSELVSKNFPAWCFGNRPRFKIIGASHTVDLAEDFGGEIRDLISSPLHQLAFGEGATLDSSSRAKGSFKTQAKGVFFGVGVGKTPIGKGANLAIIDDPIKSRKEANSPKYREELKTWYGSSIYTRLEGYEDIPASIILMHQRWHEDDLAGYLMNEHSHEGWKIMDYPALALSPDDLGRVKGEALWWERYDEEALNRIRRAVGEQDFTSMYQQRPRPDEGGEFKETYVNYYDRDPFEISNDMNIYLLVDAASSKKKNSDYTAMTVVGLGADRNYYWLDSARDKMSLVQRTENLFRLHRKWRPKEVLYEQYGAMADVEHMNGEMENESYRFKIIPIGGLLKKEERIRRILPDFESGRWWFPREMWRVVEGVRVDLVNYFIEQEMKTFPVGKHDDMLDVKSRIKDISRISWPGGNNKPKGGTVNTGIELW